jgi:hypothetical protein
VLIVNATCGLRASAVILGACAGVASHHPGTIPMTRWVRRAASHPTTCTRAGRGLARATGARRCNRSTAQHRRAWPCKVLLLTGSAIAPPLRRANWLGRIAAFRSGPCARAVPAPLTITCHGGERLVATGKAARQCRSRGQGGARPDSGRPRCGMATPGPPAVLAASPSCPDVAAKSTSRAPVPLPSPRSGRDA